MKRKVIFVLLMLIAGIIGVNIGYAEYGDIVIARKKEAMRKASVRPVLFPHWLHRIRFRCRVCHEDIFILRRGDNDINMDAIMNGQFCGKCHNGIIAWEPMFCERCHSWNGPIPPYAGPPPWEEAKPEEAKPAAK
ncbi:MAG: c(7)-type cytochrome triheme domain-containing protein [Deltaproteobacteria bacterium]